MWWIIGGVVLFILLAGGCWVFIAGTDESRKSEQNKKIKKQD